MVTHSQGKQITVPEERHGALTSESNLGCPSLEKNPKAAEMTEVVIMKSPNSASFRKGCAVINSV